MGPRTCRQSRGIRITQRRGLPGVAEIVMEDRSVIREKAVRLAVRTGVAPDLEFIWDAQKAEGKRQCFGSFQPSCPQECRWFERCRVVSTEPIEFPRSSQPKLQESDAHGTERPDTGSRIPSRSSVDRWVPSSASRGPAAIRKPPPL